MKKSEFPWSAQIPFPECSLPKPVFFGLFTNSYCGEKEVVSELTWFAFDFLQWRVYFNNNNLKQKEKIINRKNSRKATTSSW